MGRLRLEPTDPEIGLKQYVAILNTLQEAYGGHEDYDFFWHLEEGEDRHEVLRRFKHVASSNNIPLRVRVSRKERRFQLVFVEPGPMKPKKEVRQEAIKKKILSRLRGGHPVKPKHIIAYGQLTDTQWREGIVSLLKEGKVISEGHTRKLTYRLAPKKP